MRSYSWIEDGKISYDEFVAAILNSADVPVEATKGNSLLDGFFRMFD